MRRSRWLKTVAFGVIAIAVVGLGGYLAGSVFLGQRGATTVAAAMPMRISMAGFDPAVIRAKPGETVTLDWWNTDGAMHLQGGVHTMIAPGLGLDEQLPAESRKAVTWTVPNAPGSYDVYCDSCCGGKDSPTMHGKIVVEPAA